MGWLVDRLTPYKRDQRRWYDLAVALEEYWDTYQTPAVERIEQMRSVFTADNEDVEALLREAGVQFEVAIPIVRDNLAFAYSWRSYEIHRKDRQETLEQILRRDYSGVFVRWLPLYAPKDVPYGDVLLTEQDIEFSRWSREDVHQTYRGAVQVNLSGLQLAGVSATEFSAAVQRKLNVLRPAHIVYEGEYFFQAFRAEIEMWLRNGPSSFTRRTGRLIFSMMALFDDTPADAIPLDHSPISSARMTRWLTQVLGWPEMPLWGLDAGSEADGTYWPLIGREGDRRQPVGALGHWHQPASRILGAADITPASGGSIRHSGAHLLAMQRLFDAVAADVESLDYEPLLSARMGFSRGLSAPWGEMPLWGLDAGSNADGTYWPLLGREGDQRHRAGTLGHAQHWAARVPAAVALGVAGDHREKRLPPIPFSMFRLFDAVAADSASLDQEPLHAAHHATSTAARFTPWSGRPPWRLDLAALTPDGPFPVPGVEGDQAEWVGNAGIVTSKATKPSVFCLSGNKNSGKPTFKTAHWLQFVTDSAAQPALSVRGACGTAQEDERYTLAATVVRQRQPPAMPRMDDVPADFAPLDMSYEVQQ